MQYSRHCDSLSLLRAPARASPHATATHPDSRNSSGGRRAHIWEGALMTWRGSRPQRIDVLNQWRARGNSEQSWGSRIRTWIPPFRVALASDWIDVGKPFVRGYLRPYSTCSHCGRVSVAWPVLLPMCCQIPYREVPPPG